MNKEILKGLIDMLHDNDVENIYKIVIRMIPKDMPLDDEIKAINRANESIAANGILLHDDINWD